MSIAYNALYVVGLMLLLSMRDQAANGKHWKSRAIFITIDVNDSWLIDALAIEDDVEQLLDLPLG